MRRLNHHDHEGSIKVSHQHHDQHGHSVAAREGSDSFSMDTSRLPGATSTETIELGDGDVFEHSEPCRSASGSATR